MGLFDFFRSKHKTRSSFKASDRPEIDFSVASDFVRVEALNFFGPFAKSPNEKYVIAWQDWDYKGGSGGGHRESGFGRVILVSANQILYQFDMERPKDGSVANNGRVAINDWRFGLKLNGIFYVLEKNGSKLIEHHTRANLYKCGISEDSQLAWCNSASSEDENDSDKLFIFSTSPQKLLFKVDARDIPEKIQRAETEILITLRGFERRYSFDGKLINAQEVRKAEKDYIIEHGTGYQLYNMVEGILKEKDPASLVGEELEEVYRLFTKALSRKISDWYKARVYRHLGELIESKGDLVEALKQYKMAIKYDPKVGCKRAIIRLEKALKPPKRSS